MGSFSYWKKNNGGLLSDLFLSTLFLSMSNTAEFVLSWLQHFSFLKAHSIKNKSTVAYSWAFWGTHHGKVDKSPYPQSRLCTNTIGKQCDSHPEIMLTVSRCVRWCFARSLELLKAFWQPGCWHRYGFSPVWLRRWILRFSSLENALLHPSNWKKKKSHKKWL